MVLGSRLYLRFPDMLGVTSTTFPVAELRDARLVRMANPSCQITDGGMRYRRQTKRAAQCRRLPCKVYHGRMDGILRPRRKTNKIANAASFTSILNCPSSSSGVAYASTHRYDVL